MYLSKIKIENFRKFLSEEFYLQPGLNLLVGENDSGKSAIIDAIRQVLGTRDNDWLRLTPDDFHLSNEGRAKNLKIECRFDDLDEEQAGLFLEWLGIEDTEGSKKYFLRVWLEAERKDESEVTSRFDRLITVAVKAGPDDEGRRLETEARDMLRATYLQPLRDAEQGLAARRGSRLSQILFAHSDMKSQEDENDPKTLMSIMLEANKEVKGHPIIENRLGSLNTEYFKKFTLGNDQISARVDITRPSLKNILENLMLSLTDENDLDEDTPHGMGINNLLFMAVELLLVQDRGLPLLLIEEPEAHLHPQLQMRLIEFLDRPLSGTEELSVQVIMTSHSPNVAAKIDLERLTLLHKGQGFSMASQFTRLDRIDYSFLKRFLDVTKADLFFARGVLMVEGPSEQILLPAIAECLGRPLTEYGVSVVNVGHIGFFRYAHIFQRTDSKTMDIRVSCVTDLDIPPDCASYYLPSDRKTMKDFTPEQVNEKRAKKIARAGGDPVKTFVSPHWTLEYDIAATECALDMHIAITLARLSSKSSFSDAEWFDAVADAIKDYEQWQLELKTVDEIAALIYKPLSKKIVSKVEASQQLAIWFKIRLATGQETRETLRTKLPEYIVKAIDYVTRKPEVETGE